MSEKIEITDLTQLECRKGDVKLPNTTVISLFGRMEGTNKVLNRYWYDLFIKDLENAFSQGHVFGVPMGGYYLEVSSPSDVV